MAKGETTTVTGQHPLPVGPCAVVIFGASGDLTKRKLVPALYNLARQRLLPDSFAIVGVATSELGTDAFRERLDREARDHVEQGLDAETWSWLLSRVTYLPGNFRDPATYQRLVTVLNQVDAERGIGGNFVFYLATPPAFFGEIAAVLRPEGSVLVVEPPLHVSRRDFEESLAAAGKAGLRVASRPRLGPNKVALLVRSVESAGG